jgi:hypothetical protein
MCFALALTLTLATAGDAPAASGCPSREQLGAELVSLGLGPSAVDRVRLEPLPSGRQRLSLSTADGAVLAERELPVFGDCARGAQVAAVVVAAWQTELDRAHLPSTEVSVVQESVRVLPGPDWELGVSARALVLGAPGPRFGVSVPVVFKPSPGSIGGRAELSYDLPHSASLGPGEISWQRAGVALGAQAGPVLERFVLDAHVQLVGALVALSSRGFTENGSTLALDGGVSGGARFGVRLRGLRIWLAVSATLWARRSLATVEGVSGSVALPAYDLLLATGLSWSSGA